MQVLVDANPIEHVDLVSKGATIFVHVFMYDGMGYHVCLHCSRQELPW